MAYMLVRLEVAYGRVNEFSEIMSHLVPILESKGWRLHGAFVNSIGRLNRCYDLWEMPDANAVQSVLQLAAQEPAFAEWSHKLNELLVEEELELMNELPYYLERRSA
jgi:hypothetical protein